jgi:hypothetical protein
MSSVDTADTEIAAESVTSVDIAVAADSAGDKVLDSPKGETAIDIPAEYLIESVDVRAVLKEELLPIKDQLAALVEKLDALAAK